MLVMIAINRVRFVRFVRHRRVLVPMSLKLSYLRVTDDFYVTIVSLSLHRGLRVLYFPSQVYLFVSLENCSSS